MKRRPKIETFEELMALDPKKHKFSPVLSQEESRELIEESQRRTNPEFLGRLFCETLI